MADVLTQQYVSYNIAITNHNKRGRANVPAKNK